MSGENRPVGLVMTVRGPVTSKELGRTLVHEHIISDFTLPIDAPELWLTAGRRPPRTFEEKALYDAPLVMSTLGAVSMGAENRDNLILNDVETAIREIKDYRMFGGGSIVELTTSGIGRDPPALRRISEATGVHVVMGTGYYQRSWAGNHVERSTVEQLANEIEHDIDVGVPNTGIRAGVIGELYPSDPSSDYDGKVLEAAAQASRRTGAPISLDIPERTASPETVLEALDALESGGADLTRVAVGHSKEIGLDAPLIRKLLDRGVYIQFDQLGDFPHVLTKVSDHDVAVTMTDLIKQGYVDRILLSQDVCSKVDLKAYGGSGYSFVLERYAPYLRKLGVSDEQLEIIIADNPQRLLSLAEPQVD